MEYIKREQVKKALDFADLIEKVEDTYKNLGTSKIIIPPRIFSKTRDGGDYLYGACTNLITERFIVRSSAYSPWLKEEGKDPVNCHYMLSSFAKNELLAVLEGADIVNHRTAAKTATVVKKLAKTDSRKLGMIGFGASGHKTAIAVAEVLDLDEIYVFVRTPEKWNDNKDKAEAETGVKVSFVNLDRLMQNSDVVVLATWTEEPLISEDDVSKGQLIVSTAHKLEVPVSFFNSFKSYIDYFPTAKGEYGPYKQGLEDGVQMSNFKGELADLLNDEIEGRNNDDEIIYFQSLGVMLEDLAAVEMVYDIHKNSYLPS